MSEALRCPYCHADLAGQAVAYCPTCTTPHHTLCFNDAGCTVLGCVGANSAGARAPRVERPWRGLGRALLALGLGCSLFLCVQASTYALQMRPHPELKIPVPTEAPQETHWSCALASGHLHYWHRAEGSGQGLYFGADLVFFQDPQGFAWIWSNADGGVSVTKVEPGSAAEQAGLRRGDVITHLGETPVGEVRASVAWGQHYLNWPSFESVDRQAGATKLRGLGEASQPWQVVAFHACQVLSWLTLLLGVGLWGYRRRTQEPALAPVEEQRARLDLGEKEGKPPPRPLRA